MLAKRFMSVLKSQNMPVADLWIPLFSLSNLSLGLLCLCLLACWAWSGLFLEWCGLVCPCLILRKTIPNMLHFSSS
jgi:hypothetical protein